MLTSNHFESNLILKEIVQPLLIWYRSQARILPWREDPSPYRVWISEIMLQQTRVEAVKPYFERFLTALPTIKDLACAEEDSLLKLWEGLGYYNRARNLQKAAKIIMSDHHGHLPSDFSTLLSLPGIGRYTAGAISSIAYGQCQAAVDGNVLRVITRILLCSEDILKEKTKRTIEASLLEIMPVGQAAGDFNQSLMELGATICLPHETAHCPQCPLKRLCRAYAENCVSAYPKKTSAKNRRKEKLTIFLLEMDGKLAIHRRPSTGLLAGLWEFPNLPGHLTKKEVLEKLSLPKNTSIQIQKLPAAKHIFSHIEWHMIGWHIQFSHATTQIKESPAHYGTAEVLHELFWNYPEEIIQQYSIPTAFQYYFLKNRQEVRNLSRN